jgi:Flp pilus assembly protein TadD
MENAYSLLAKGQRLLETRHPAQAAVVLERAKDLEPNKASIREALARAYYNYGQYQLSKKEFTRALEIEPTNHYAHFGLGLCFSKIGNKMGARRHLRIAIAMEPDERYEEALKRIVG